MKPRTLCACHHGALMISARVAPPFRPRSTRMTAFLLPSRGVAGLSAFLAVLALTGRSFATLAGFAARVPLPTLVAVVFGAFTGSASRIGTTL